MAFAMPAVIGRLCSTWKTPPASSRWTRCELRACIRRAVQELGIKHLSAPPPSAGRTDDSPIGSTPSGPAQPIKRDMPKVGRNDPCPCGSGKKYKKCHGAAEA